MRSTLLYFSGGLAATSLITAFSCLHPGLVFLIVENPYLYIFGLTCLLGATQTVSYRDHPMAKRFLWGTFMAGMS